MTSGLGCGAREAVASKMRLLGCQGVQVVSRGGGLGVEGTQTSSPNPCRSQTPQVMTRLCDKHYLCGVCGQREPGGQEWGTFDLQAPSSSSGRDRAAAGRGVGALQVVCTYCALSQRICR